MREVYPPILYLIDGASSPEEVQSVHVVNGALTSLEREVALFGAAFSLFDTISRQERELSAIIRNNNDIENHVETLRVYGQWIEIVLKQGAVIARNVLELMKSIGSGVGKSKIVSENFDRHSKRCGDALYQGEFPGLNDVRDSIAHPGAPFISALHLENHQLSEDFSGDPGFISAGNSFVSIAGNTYTTSWKGRVISYTLSLEKLTALQQVAACYFDAFRPVKVACDALNADFRNRRNNR